MKAAWLAAALLPLPALPAAAQEASPAPVVSSAEADKATPKPASLAAALGLPGVNPQLDITGFGQALVSGDGGKDAKLTARADLFVDFSSKGLGLWEGTTLRTHTELRANDPGAGSFGGALWPSNTGAVLPLTGQGIELTSLYIVQNLGPKTNLIVGKVNAVDLLAGDPFFGGWGTKRFQNVAFVAPPSGLVPPTIMGTILTHQVGSVGLTAMVFDPEDRSGNYGLNGLFSTGVNLSLGGTWQGPMAGRKTSIGLTLAGSTSRGRDFEDLLAPPDLATSTKKGSYNIALQFGHSLTSQDKGPGSLGLYSKAAIADGNPNLIQSSFIGGLAGQGLFSGRPNDRFGLGGYYYNFSNILQQVTAPLVKFHDELGFEAWYALTVLPNADLTFNAQLTDPARGQKPNAFLLGARFHVHF